MNRKLDQPKRNDKENLDTVETTGVHADQALFVQKLKMIKRFMFKVKLLYRGEEMNLWDFAALGEEPVYEKVMFEEKVRKGRLGQLFEALIDCESFVAQIFDELDIKASMRRWLNLKIFGTFE